MDQSVEELVKKVKNGDQMAATDLYDKTSSKAFYLALELVKDEDMAQDILQDSYVKAFTNLNTLSDPAKFQSWLNSIVVNTSKNYLKKKSPILFSQMTTTNDEGDEQDIDFEDESEEFSPEATVDYSETKRLVQEMIDNLPDAQRTAIVLHYMEDYSVKQIAEIMECTESTVKSRLNYGRKQLEKDVLDLEKKGTKLYCAPLIPFLIWMFHTSDAYAAFSTGAAAISEAVEAAASEAAASAAVATEASATATSATVTAKAAAGAAVKAGAGAVGKATIAKVVAAVAAVCVLGGGVAAGVTISRHNNPNVVTEAGVTNTIATNENGTSFLEEIAESLGIIDPNAIIIADINEKEKSALSSLYQAMEERDRPETVNVLAENFSTIYALEQKYCPGRILAFDGETLSTDLNGKVLALMDSSSYTEGDINEIGYSGTTGYFRIYAWFGDFTNGQPNGSIFATYLGLDDFGIENVFENIYKYNIYFMENEYDMGDVVGESRLEEWINDYLYSPERDSTCELRISQTFTSNFQDGDPVGDFELIVNEIGGERTAGYLRHTNEQGRFTGMMSSEWSNYVKHDLVFFGNWEQYINYRKGILSDEEEYIADETETFYYPLYRLSWVRSGRHLFWGSDNLYHDEGTERLLPNGFYLNENGDVINLGVSDSLQPELEKKGYEGYSGGESEYDEEYGVARHVGDVTDMGYELIYDDGHCKIFREVATGFYNTITGMGNHVEEMYNNMTMFPPSYDDTLVDPREITLNVKTVFDNIDPEEAGINDVILNVKGETYRDWRAFDLKEFINEQYYSNIDLARKDGFKKTVTFTCANKELFTNAHIPADIDGLYQATVTLNGQDTSSFSADGKTYDLVVTVSRSSEDIDSAENISTDNLTGEDIIYDVHNLSQEQLEMLTPMDSLAYIMTGGYNADSKDYAPEDPKFVWDTLIFFAPRYIPTRYDNNSLLSLTNDHIVFNIPRDLLEEYSTILFSGSSYDGKLPEWDSQRTSDRLYWYGDNLIIYTGDRGDESWRISSWIEHPDGTVTAETQILDGSMSELYGVYRFELTPNHDDYADFAYKITDAMVVHEYNFPDFPHVDSDGNIIEGTSGGDYILAESSNRYYTESELNSLTKDELRLARNEIYARHGRIFDSADLDSYFRSKNWYNPTISASQFSESVLNAYEKANIETIQALEAKK